jgi:hypothetical protein
MSARLRHRLFTLFCLVALALGSVTSAGMMAPDQHDRAKARIAALGFAPDDLCGHIHDNGHDQGHEHRCPYCHLLDAVSLPRPAGLTRRVVPVPSWRQADDLHRHAQARDHARSPRAPPFIA